MGFIQLHAFIQLHYSHLQNQSGSPLIPQQLISKLSLLLTTKCSLFPSASFEGAMEGVRIPVERSRAGQETQIQEVMSLCLVPDSFIPIYREEVDTPSFCRDTA